MATEQQFRECVREYEERCLNRSQPKFRIGNNYDIRKQWDKGWEYYNQPGIYAFYNKDGVLIYVGKADYLDRRTGSYFRRNTENVVETIQKWADEPIYLQYVAVTAYYETHSLEAYVISKLKPTLNARGK